MLEYRLQTDPLQKDSNGDGLPDGMEDADGDGVTDVEEYRSGSNPFALETHYFYDRSDRLVGVQFTNSLAIGYQYDANGNLVRQLTFNRLSNNDALSPLWKFLNGLSPTNSSGLHGQFADFDGDGWSNFQEWKGGSSPTDSASVPTNTVQTAPSVEILPLPNQGQGQALVRVRIWDGEANNALPFLQYSNAATLAWSNATLTQVNGTNLSLLAKGVAAPPTGTTNELRWNAAADLGDVATNVWLRARAQDQASTNLFGAWSAEMPYTLIANPDTDDDGIPDAWELAYFGSLAQSATNDFDLDGFSDFAEFVADTNPTNAASYLRITGLLPVPDGYRIEWQGGTLAMQYLRQLDDLGTNLWQNIATSYPPTPITGSFTNTIGTNRMQFYRIEAQR